MTSGLLIEIAKTNTKAVWICFSWSIGLAVATVFRHNTVCAAFGVTEATGSMIASIEYR